MNLLIEKRLPPLYSHVIVYLIWGSLVLGVASCGSAKFDPPPPDVLASMGNKFKMEYTQAVNTFQKEMDDDPQDIKALLSFAEMKVLLYVFGLSSRAETVPEAMAAVQKASVMDSVSSPVHTLQGIMHFLDWEWMLAQSAFEKAIQADPSDPKPRHWYSLWLVSMLGDFDAAMKQSDTIMTLDPSGDYQVGRGSLMYFERENEALKQLMRKTIDQDPSIPWGYDWLGMAHIELKEYDASIQIYQKAFELSDGLVEVGGGLGHALGLAGADEPARMMADYYTKAARTQYLPPVQRAFIHLGIGEYDQAISLLDQAYNEKSWFIIFMQIEPWYDPIRKDARFLALVDKMNYPKELKQ
jgi:tetratricopeptide (TPR) repeat protein